MKTDDLFDDATESGASTRDALLRRAYEGEVIGCAMYDRMIDDASHANKEALQLLYVIERMTADALKPLIDRYEVTVSEDAATREGCQLATALVGRPWKEMWTEVTRLADDYLTDFKRLADMLEGDEATVGRQVVEHEEALIAFARREINDAHDALAPLADYRQRYAL
jgi:hypothetical protein